MVIALVIRGKIYRLHLIRLGIKRKRKNPFGVAMTVFCNNIAHITHLHSLPAIGGSVKSTSMFFITNPIFSRITPLFQKKKQ